MPRRATGVARSSLLALVVATVSVPWSDRIIPERVVLHYTGIRLGHGGGVYQRRSLIGC